MLKSGGRPVLADHSREHTSRAIGLCWACVSQVSRNRLGEFVNPSHLVWGYVFLTGIAAAVPPGFHSL